MRWTKLTWSGACRRCLPVFREAAIRNIKRKNDWWAPPEYMNVEYSDAAMALMQKVLFEEIPDIIVKHADAIAARYKMQKPLETSTNN